MFGVGGGPNLQVGRSRGKVNGCFGSDTPGHPNNSSLHGLSREQNATTGQLVTFVLYSKSRTTCQHYLQLPRASSHQIRLINPNNMLQISASSAICSRYRKRLSQYS